MSAVRHLVRSDGARIAYRVVGVGRPVLLLHGTLSTGGQLRPLARALAADGDLAVIAVDRRGSGESRLSAPGPLDVATHVADLAAILDAEGHEAAALVGHSFGGVVGLEFAARLPGRTRAVVAYEPPYGLLADEATRGWFAALAVATERAGRERGDAAAAETFLRAVAGDAAWDGLSARARAFLAAEGGGARADVSLGGADPEGLRGIVAPVTLITGDASDALYAPIAEALAARIPTARRVRLPGLRHPAPITDPEPVAAAVRAALVEAGSIEAGLIG
jgi:pimeloyl-ACP methyl ester carboxylesterase